MTDHNVIDGRDRFSSRRAEARRINDEDARKQADKQRLARKNRREEHAKKLRNRLFSTARLDLSDRKVLARNLGKAIERRKDARPTKRSADLFHRGFGAEGGASMEKKRKRYIRFDGEDSEADQVYAASGKTFLRLIEALAKELGLSSADENAENELLLAMCNGTSFFGSSREQLDQTSDPYNVFKKIIGEVVERVMKNTEIVDYLDQVQNYTIQTDPMDPCFGDSSKPDEDLRIQPIKALKRLSANGDGTLERLRLEGFDVHAKGISPLYPVVRLARVYWPHHVLCLPAFVDASQVEESKKADWECFESYQPGQKKPMEKPYEDMISSYEFDLWRGAIEQAGFNPDPEALDWMAFENESTGEALLGAEWRVFWLASNVNLHLIADGRSDVLQIGLSISEVIPRSLSRRSLSSPANDDGGGTKIGNCEVLELPGSIPWFPNGDHFQVCRGLYHFIPGDDFWSDGPGMPYMQSFDPHLDDGLSDLYPDGPIPRAWALDDERIWDFLTRPMKDWQVEHATEGTSERSAEPLSMRLLIDAPDGATPLPENSLAAAILRSIAYGEGEERLDEMLISRTNNLVRCFREMKENLDDEFAQALARNGYGTRAAQGVEETP